MRRGPPSPTRGTEAPALISKPLQSLLLRIRLLWVRLNKRGGPKNAREMWRGPYRSGRGACALGSGSLVIPGKRKKCCRGGGHPAGIGCHPAGISCHPGRLPALITAGRVPRAPQNGPGSPAPPAAPSQPRERAARCGAVRLAAPDSPHRDPAPPRSGLPPPPPPRPRAYSADSGPRPGRARRAPGRWRGSYCSRTTQAS